MDCPKAKQEFNTFIGNATIFSLDYVMNHGTESDYYFFISPTVLKYIDIYSDVRPIIGIYRDACQDFKDMMKKYDFTKPVKILNMNTCCDDKLATVKTDVEYMYAGCSPSNCYFRQEDIICILKIEIDKKKETTCDQKSNEPMKFDEMMNIFIEFGLNLFDACEFYISPNVLKYVELDVSSADSSIWLYTNASKGFKETIEVHDFTKPVGVLNLNELLGGSSDKNVKTDLTFGNSYNYCRIRQEDIICVRKKSAKSERRHHAKIYAAYANDSECCVMEWDDVNGHQTGTVAHHHFNLPENKSFAVFQKVYLDFYQCLCKDSNGIFVVSEHLPIKKIMEMKRSGQDIKVINESKRTMVAWEDTPSIISLRKT